MQALFGHVKCMSLAVDVFLSETIFIGAVFMAKSKLHVYWARSR